MAERWRLTRVKGTRAYLRGRREVDDWGLLSGIDDWATILDLGPVALVAAVGL